ncbi:hypothetical protein [Flavobacterium sp.]|uniref:hypothetical protein n=1 Tax=Flavobacterium sp. TaxID=239 RepID=UPI0028BEB59B|nr:hypothetical protein [Flavobacterium sp.]
MKAKSFKMVLLVLLSIICLPVYPSTTNDTIPATAGTTIEAERAQQLINRLEEIKSIDRSTLTRVEKRELRKEVKSINKQLKGSNGVYLSVGAIIIIILLLILLL